MDKEKEIEDKIEITVFYAKKEAEKQADKFGYRGDKREFHILSTIAKVLVVAGYRKAEEVRKETAKEILLYLKATITDGLLKNHEILNALMKEYGIDVEE